MKSLIKRIIFTIILNLYLCEGCPDGCECSEGSEICSSCKIGYYNLDNNCTSECLNCPGESGCDDEGICIDDTSECLNPEYYGTQCKDECKIKLGANCVTCDRNGIKCTECFESKFWGTKCEESCSKCPDGTCNPENGVCLTQSEYCSNREYHGEKCDEKCNTGNNRQHCVECYMIKNNCTTCENNKYFGETCEKECNLCPQQTCDIEGNCGEGEKCFDEKYTGNKCDKLCEEVYPNCLTCTRNDVCTSCAKSFYGNLCRESCTNCPGEDCYDNDGKCKDDNTQCNDKIHFGDNCKTPCTSSDHSNCVECLRDGICTVCKNNKYKEDYCTELCDKCPNGECSQNGTCIDPSTNCENDKTHGDDCEESCNAVIPECLTCKRNGECLSCEDNKNYGKKCEESCDKCPGEICKMNGECINEGNCLNNDTYGPFCNDTCNLIGDYCDKCSRDGKCVKCTDQSHFSDDCNQICDKCPGKICKMNGECINEGNCFENETYGPFCNDTCNLIGDYCDKCSRDGKCIKCTEETHFGDDCNQICDKCPGQICNIKGECIYEGNCFENETYGPFCNDTCNLIGDYCDKCSRDGKCIKCTEETHFGDDCNQICDKCPDQKCYIDGTCKNNDSNCHDETFYGPKCNDSCILINTHCETCNRNKTCSKCDDLYFYGEFCNKTCDNCPNKECNFDGTCVDDTKPCIDDTFYGVSCDLKCNETRPFCYKCDREGKCTTCTEKKYFGYDCNDDCSNCPDEKCFINGTCEDPEGDCMDTLKYGSFCNDSCSEIEINNCINCHRNESCFTCLDKTMYGPKCDIHCDLCPENLCENNGTCVDNNGDCLNNATFGEKCDRNCSELYTNNCKFCTRKEICIECYDISFYGKNCSIFCDNCPDHLCYNDGKCVNNETNCIDEHYYEDYCKKPCTDINPNCDTCTRNGICTTCKDISMWGDQCDRPCDKCPGNKCYNNGTCVLDKEDCINSTTYGDDCNTSCSNINDNCVLCHRDSICFQCDNKTYYGPFCNDSCSNCPGINGICDNDGICEDKNTNCDDDRLTGPKCDKSCNITYGNCLRCDRNNTCLECIFKEFYGPFCNYSCANCPGEKGFCDINGICYDQDTECDDNTLTGPNCDRRCNETYDNCYRCDRNNTCLECIFKEFYGPFCNYSCANCPGEKGFCDINGICDDQDTECDDNTLTGPNCDRRCNETYDNCYRCDRNNTCLECINKEFYGPFCNYSCANCPGEKGLCDINGICYHQDIQCDDNTLTGPNCDRRCNETYDNCYRCDRNNTCLECIYKEFYGPFCNYSCANCPGEKGFCDINGTCEDQDTECDDNTLTGPNCDRLCNETYDNCYRCDRNNTCLECIFKEFYGPFCNYSCANCPGEKGFCDINGTCDDQDTECDDNTLTGPNCDRLCNVTYDNCYRCDRNNTCLECIFKEFYGPFCNDSCANCPGEIEKCDINGICDDNHTECVDNTFRGEKCDTPCNNNTEIYDNCRNCTRDNTCLECFNRTYYGDKCKDECFECPGDPGYCYINGTCEDETGICDDDTLTGPFCNVSCNVTYNNCLSCYRDNICFKCINETFFGPYCNYSCGNCPGECYVDGTCKDNETLCLNDEFTGPKCDLRCNETYQNCFRCDRSNICSECIFKEFYGPFCNDSCANCPGEIEKCDINGICDDNHTECVDNTFRGEKCDTPCNNNTEIYDNCRNCTRDNTCLECFNRTYYGDKCKDECFQCPGDPGYCYINGTCEDETGICDDDTLTGPFCNVSCSVAYNNCLSCYRDNICFKCINETFFGPYCNYSCANCPGSPGYCDNKGICYNSEDLCDDDTFTGANCSVPCNQAKENCKRCDRNNTCLECFDQEMFGPDCNTSCANCPGNGTCDIDGICEDQTSNCDDDRLTGPKCDTPCKEEYDNCLRCDRDNICHECINREFYGPFCNDSCKNCPGEKGLCYNNGTCENEIDNCDDDRLTGPKCDTPCNDTYNNCYRCDRKNVCLECINKNKYGNFCNDSCANCPGEIEKCNITGICYDQVTECVDNTLRGEKCDTPCNNDTKIYDNCRNCTRNNTCIECINKESYGDFCNISCANCPGNCSINGICIDQTSDCDDDSFKGEACQTPCGNCKRCHRNNSCIECFDQRYHGENCSTICSGCSETGCDIQGYCREFKCRHGTYGLKCDTDCTCRQNSNSIECGKYEGQCISCKFGYYGKDCDQYCNYKCQSELCCLFKDHTRNIKSKFEFTSDYRYVNIGYEGQTYKVEIDYNYGYPMTLFNYEGKLLLGKDKEEDQVILNFTNYIANGTLLKGKSITINGKEIKNIHLVISDNKSVEYKSEKDDSIKGVIGLGFFNSISNTYFPGEDRSAIQLNILSYALDGNDISMLFGNMHKDEIDYVDKLTSCEVILDNSTEIQGKKMTCQLDGIKSSKHTDAFRLKNAYITFSLAEKSSLILGNNIKYKEYLEKVYFRDEAEFVDGSHHNSTISYFLYPDDKINRLSDFGFVFNSYYYSYKPTKFFPDSSIGGKKKFLIEIRNDTEKTEFVIGKEFLENFKFTINNEEAKIYFYAKNAMFSDEFTDEVQPEGFNIKLAANEISLICLAIIIFLNFVAFGAYFFFKKRKMNNNNYISV